MPFNTERNTRVASNSFSSNRDQTLPEALGALVLEALKRIDEPMSVELLTAAIPGAQSREVTDVLKWLHCARLVRTAHVTERWCLTPAGSGLARDGVSATRRHLRIQRVRRT